MNLAETESREVVHAEFSDEGNACRLINEFGHQLKYLPAWNQWLIWDRTRWIEDRLMLVERLAAQCIAGMVEEAQDAQTDGRRVDLLKWAVRSHEARRLKNMVELAKPKVAITPEVLERV